MQNGYMNRFLWVDLSTGSVRQETPDPQVLHQFLGGYGVGAKVLYDHMKPGVDPLGPENVLGFVTGPLTGTPAITGTRFTVVGKSPLTGTWGDANCGGYFGPALRRSGYDAVFFTGASSQPVYLYIEDSLAELRDAADLWGRDCYEIEDWAKAKLGADVEAACIGPAGEKLSLISAVMHSKGRAAGRSGLAAVMGSKRLKMVAVRGSGSVPLADPEAVATARTRYLKEIRDGVGFANFYKQTGTPGYTPTGLVNGDSPTQNWRSSVLAFPDAEPLQFSELLKLRVKRSACWHCPLACWGTSRVEYEGAMVEAHQPEYETASAFGSMMLNNHYPSIIKANDTCNRLGLDTISAGTCVAFAFECFELGLIRSQDTGGLSLTWGNHQAMNALLERIGVREGLGDVLADGVKRAAERIGPQAEPLAMHAGGQELPMHDPRLEPAMAVVYQADATPGRHTQSANYLPVEGSPWKLPKPGMELDRQQGRGSKIYEPLCFNHSMNAAGVCLFGYLATRVTFVSDFVSAVTGRMFTMDDMLTTGERIANIRQAFNVREGFNLVHLPIPKRAYGMPPLPDGLTAGVTVQYDLLLREHLERMGWTLDAAVPRRETLERLGLANLAKDLWG